MPPGGDGDQNRAKRRVDIELECVRWPEQQLQMMLMLLHVLVHNNSFMR